MASSTALFREKAPEIMRSLMSAFGLTADSAAAIVGNLGHESGGFRFLQEKKPLVPGSKGGWGWAQWTGPRRRQFEAWVRARGLDPASDEANLGFLCHELRGSEKAAIPAVVGALGLREKVEAFERAFERAGVKHYESRLRWAEMALAAFEGRPVTAPARTAGDAKRASPEDALQPFEVAAIQKRLRELGYFMVGKVDGQWGPSTAAAITALQTQAKALDPGAIVDGHYGPRTKAALADDRNRRVVTEARAGATASDLKAQGSTTIIKASRISLASVAGFLGSLVSMALYIAANYEATRAALPPAADLALAGLPGWAPIGAAILYTGWTWLNANGVIEARVRAERSGLHNGEPDPAPKLPVSQALEPDQGVANVLGGFFGGLRPRPTASALGR